MTMDDTNDLAERVRSLEAAQAVAEGVVLPVLMTTPALG
jgi:hypothetical protein